MAKIDEQYLRLQLEQTDLVALVSEIVEHARPLAARKDIRLELQIRRVAADIQVDSQKMERAVVNLVSNALKFSNPGGFVQVWMDATESGVEIGVVTTALALRKSIGTTCSNASVKRMAR